MDLACPEDGVIFAPFDGEISAYRPMGGNEAKEGAKEDCVADQGVRIDGLGQWQGKSDNKHRQLQQECLN